MENGKINEFDKSSKNIVDTLISVIHCPINHVCLLNHDDNGFKCYVDDSAAMSQRVYDAIMITWNVKEENISIERSPESWWPLGSTGYIIEVKYE